MITKIDSAREELQRVYNSLRSFQPDQGVGNLINKAVEYYVG